MLTAPARVPLAIEGAASFADGVWRRIDARGAVQHVAVVMALVIRRTNLKSEETAALLVAELRLVFSDGRAIASHGLSVIRAPRLDASGGRAQRRQKARSTPAAAG